MKDVLIIEHAPQRAEELVTESIKYGVSYRLWRPYMDETLNRAILSFDGLIVGGGPMGAYELDKFPFFGHEIRLIEQAFEHKIPTLGVCLGAQIFAKMLGCEVRKNSWRRGYQYVDCTKEALDDPLFKDIPGSFPTFQYHQDDIMSLPSRSILTLTSSDCKIEGFSLQDIPVWATQFHPEIGVRKATKILQSVKDLNADDIDIMLKESSNELLKVNSRLFENFFSISSH